LDTRLRERYFGEWNGQPDHHYADVWTQDEIDSAHTLHHVESVDSVMERTTALIIDLDEKLTNALQEKQDLVPPSCSCILVAHGDVLQILQTAFHKCSGRRHRSLPHLETASLRKLHLLT
jgi:probable phosphoglycerate mutase